MSNQNMMITLLVKILSLKLPYAAPQKVKKDEGRLYNIRETQIEFSC